ncbi:hypothetical protein D0T53_02565 [Dysgonomonas sp. 216]|uniref:hypothetical protein n=1 Tax=Dysgonomonas sp. 216 TaxID=2302934 RepID=UPI0013CFA831|nr:hypothetical protein [Dysgonomonas sp. 216]NDW17798.1 hypothetical protein [Dysgonomonas sp. 216]
MSLLDYIKGLRKGKEARRIEIEAMSDPFLSEAIDGYDLIKGDHLTNIAQLQKQVAMRSYGQKKRYFIPYASAAAVLLLISYITFFENPFNKTSIDDDNLYVYIPQTYLEQKKMELAVSPQTNFAAEIKNMEILTPEEELDIFIPAEYVEQIKNELSEKEKVEHQSAKVNTVITNLDDLFTPNEVMDIYLPADFTEKRRTDVSPRTNIQNAGNNDL